MANERGVLRVKTVDDDNIRIGCEGGCGLVVDGNVVDPRDVSVHSCIPVVEAGHRALARELASQKVEAREYMWVLRAEHTTDSGRLVSAITWLLSWRSPGRG